MKKLIGIFIAMIFMTISISVCGIDNHKLLLIETRNPILVDEVFDSIIESLMKRGHYPSLSTCIIKDNQVLWSGGYGFRDLENDLPATDNTIYVIASITKTITGTALMQLCEQGLFDLDDDVNDYLPFTLRNPNFPNEPITFKMLLSHSSSFKSDPSLYYWLKDEFLPNNFSFWYPYPWLKEYLVPGGEWYSPLIWNDKFRPGERSAYANINFDLIAYLVERISGKSFTDYCDEHIFVPLEMWNTSFHFDEINMEQMAVHYLWDPVERKHYIDHSFDDEISHPEHYCPVGGLLTSVLDLSHFMIAHMNGGVYKEVRILKEVTVDEMHKIQPTSNEYFGYGLAWLTIPHTFWIGSKIIAFTQPIYSGHGGDLDSCHTRMYMKLSGDIGVIFFINTGRSHSSSWNSAELLIWFLFLKANRF